MSLNYFFKKKGGIELIYSIMSDMINFKPFQSRIKSQKKAGPKKKKTGSKN
jgi:hypothetical protein